MVADRKAEQKADRKADWKVNGWKEKTGRKERGSPYTDQASTLTQVRYLGNCLKGDTWEWYIQNIEHHNRVIHEWTLESALIEMQKHILHSLTHRYASMTYETTRQGSGTVQDLLNRQ